MFRDVGFCAPAASQQEPTSLTIKRIRITDEVPPRISVIDLAAAITKKNANHAAQDVAYVKERHPEVTQILGDFKFRGQGRSENMRSVFVRSNLIRVGGTRPRRKNKH